MKSLLFQGVTPFTEPPDCGAIPCRVEVPLTIRKGGRLYNFVLRDKVVPEDVYLMMIKGAAFAIAEREPYTTHPPDRSIRDFLIKDTVVI